MDWCDGHAGLAPVIILTAVRIVNETKMQAAPSFSSFPSVQNLRALAPNVPDQRPRVSDGRLGTEPQSRGPLDPVCQAVLHGP